MNRLLRPLVIFAVLLGLASAAVAAAPNVTTFLIVRHAEKSAPNGDLPLSAAGHERAATLATMLAGAGVTHVYQTEMIRARETAGPLAARLSLTPKTVPVAQGEVLANELKALPVGSVVLVANHSGTIPALVERLGATKPAAIVEEQYDLLFIVTRHADGTATSLQLRYGRPTDAPPAK
jgi:broad specificity phosphatase PhoE